MGLTKGLSVDEEFKLLDKMSEHEQVVFCNDPSSGLRAIIAIHNTTLGPALGGCRMHPYPSLDHALDDVLRLSKGMSYKCAAADVDFGGGKAVIIGDPQTDKTAELFRAFGQFVESLGGRFYTGTDMGTTMDDFIHSMRETKNIVGVPEAYGGGGDSSIPTAMGVIYGIRATNQTLFGSNTLSRATYSIQGLGKVGYKVAEYLLEQGAHITVTDVCDENIRSIQRKAATTSGAVSVVEPHEIYSQNVDLFIPCAVGGVINDETIDLLKVKAVVGSANNQLKLEEHGNRLAEKGILYAPDYIVNAGGLIQVADELYGANKERVLSKTKEIYHIILDVYQQANSHQITTLEAANRICEKLIAEKARRNSFYTRSVRPKWDIRNQSSY
ncbi:phenylalanine dehydrogenase [Oceanobacillus limi]|uniref:Phenylalanine dehydrogenase n=1 Tax=Oceanobacillus limi TaxID=930131 RepID=A0A1I0EZ11_9BACI|nr:Glu/Leu/Phe/Val dehydrogenase [Oceanobacillus limi]SET50190.1 phenylalanine dehydrogenase [Oceanobacillus limi]